MDYVSMKWTKEETKLLSTKVAAFNRKIDRVLKKDPDMKKYLPKKLYARELRAINEDGESQIETKMDYNRMIKSLSNFTERGAEKLKIGKNGTTTTTWQHKENQKMKVAINLRKERIIKKYANLSQGQLESLGLLKTNYDINTINQKSLAAKTRTLRKQQKSNYWVKMGELYKQNYLLAVKHEFIDSGSEVLSQIGQDIYDKVSILSPITLQEELNTNPIADIEFVYDLNEAIPRAKSIRSLWYKY